MEISKPKVDMMRVRAKQLYGYFKINRHRYCTKEELVTFMGLHERSIRDIINWLRNKHVMIISTSASKGYKLADPENKEDIEEVKHMLYEFERRKLELESVEKCCNSFLIKNVK